MASKVEYQDLEVKGTVKANEFADGVLKNSGFEVVTELPTTGLFAGREVMYNGKKYVYSSGWQEEITANTMYEANLLWGGRNIPAGFSPVDAAMMSELSSNVIAFPNPEGISIEHSRDGGVTWMDYEMSDEGKVNLFTSNGFCLCGNSSTTALGMQLRITITPAICGFYTSLNKIILFSYNFGSSKSWCTLKGLTSINVNAGNEDDSFYSTIFERVSISGSPSYNVLNFRQIYTAPEVNNYNQWFYRLRLVFGFDEVSNANARPLTITQLRFFGSYRFTLPSNLAKYNHLYTYDWKQNALFPAKVQSKEVINFDINNIEPTQTGTVSKTSTWLWQYLIQGINWLKVKLANGLMSLNSTTVKLGDSAVLPWYVDYNEVNYPARLRDNWLQIYRHGVWGNLMYLSGQEAIQPTQVVQITSFDNLDWYNKQVSEYEVDNNTTQSILAGTTLPAAALMNCLAEQLVLNLYPVSGKKYGKGSLDSLISDLQGKGFSVFVENDLDAILASGSDYLVRVKISKVPTVKAIIECYMSR